MIEFNTADGEKLTLMHDGVVVKGAPGSDVASLFVGGIHFPLRASYEEVVGEMEHFVYGPDKPGAEENQQTQAAQVAAEAEVKETQPVHAAEPAPEEAPGAGTEQQPA